MNISNKIQQYVAEPVSRNKFQRELNIYEKKSNYYRARGIIMLTAEFPLMEFIFLAPQLKPMPVVFAVRIGFENFDMEPLSVKFIDITTGELVPANQMNTVFSRKSGITQDGKPIPNRLLMSEAPDSPPFLCMQGTREYHEHPYHSGDSWLLHRKKGKGRLAFILDKLYDYGIDPLNGYQLNIQTSIPVLHLAHDLTKIPD